MGLRNERLRSDEVPINVAYLRELQQKEVGHDTYVRAARAIGIQQTRVRGLIADAGLSTEKAYLEGWLACLKDYNTLVMSFLEQEMESHPHIDQRPQRVRKGQQCLMDEPGCRCLLALRSVR